MTKFVVVHKPNVVEIPESCYKTVGDLVAAVGIKDAELLGSGERLTYTLLTASGEELALSGPEYNPGLELLQRIGTTFDIKAHIKVNYQVRYQLPDRGRGYQIGVVTVYWKDSIAKLKERIERQTRIPRSLQQLRKSDVIMRDEETLFGCAIFDNDLITLDVQASLKFNFKNEYIGIGFLVSDDLSTVLKRAIQSLGQTSETLLFEIAKSSGAVDNGSCHWLQDRSSLFELGDVQGTMLDNGLLDGDELRVYKKNPKRKRDQDA